VTNRECDNDIMTNRYRDRDRYMDLWNVRQRKTTTQILEKGHRNASGARKRQRKGQ